jgi:hypothetical protein
MERACAWARFAAPPRAARARLRVVGARVAAGAGGTCAGGACAALAAPHGAGARWRRRAADGVCGFACESEQAVCVTHTVLLLAARCLLAGACARAMPCAMGTHMARDAGPAARVRLRA